MQSAGIELALVYLCDMNLQQGVHNWIGQRDFGKLLRRISGFKTKKLLVIFLN